MANISYDEASHLLRRAGFGGNPAEINDLVARGREAAVDYLVDYDTNHSIKEVARAIFRSDEFFGERARFALVKTPVDLVVGAVRALEADYEIALVSPIDYGYKLYYRRLGDMGMDLFAPPDVAGWNLNLAWINPTFLIERFNFANALITNRDTNPLVGGPFVTVEQLRRHTRPSADETVDNYLRLLGPIHLDPETRNRLINFLHTDSQGNPSPFKTDDETIENRVRGRQSETHAGFQGRLRHADRKVARVRFDGAIRRKVRGRGVHVINRVRRVSPGGCATL